MMRTSATYRRQMFFTLGLAGAVCAALLLAQTALGDPADEARARFY